MTTNEFNTFSDNVADRKNRETASQVADFCREVIATGEMTADEASVFANQWMADVQDRAADGGF